MKALILCGGKGERLRPLTESVPKPLVPIKGKPIIFYILSHLKEYNIDEVVIASGYKSEKIEEYFEKENFSQEIQIVDSGDVDIVKRIKDAKNFLEDDFLLIYGDTLSDVNINDLKKYHNEHEGDATVTLWPMRSPFGILEVNDKGLVSSYQEKPLLDKWINIGYFIFSKSLLDTFDGFDSFEKYINNLVKTKSLNGYKHQGLHITVNTQKELSEAEGQVESLMTSLGE